jgi:ubiquinone/menaquinone biosynthesis C-methylase UbiE
LGREILASINEKSTDLPKSPFPHWLSIFLVNPLRKRSIDRQKVMEESEVKAGMSVLELGCGPGFFSEYLAKAVGPKGHLICQDIQPQMIAKLKKRSARFPVNENISTLLANSTSLSIDSDSIDLVFAAYVFEEIFRERQVGKTAKELLRVLKPGGRLVVIEHKYGVKLEQVNRILELIEQSGLRLVKRYDNKNYQAQFRKEGK